MYPRTQAPIPHLCVRVLVAQVDEAAMVEAAEVTIVEIADLIVVDLALQGMVDILIAIVRLPGIGTTVPVDRILSPDGQAGTSILIGGEAQSTIDTMTGVPGGLLQILDATRMTMAEEAISTSSSRRKHLSPTAETLYA
jgi:hypothetical protein